MQTLILEFENVSIYVCHSQTNTNGNKITVQQCWVIPAYCLKNLV